MPVPLCNMASNALEIMSSHMLMPQKCKIATIGQPFVINRHITMAQDYNVNIGDLIALHRFYNWIAQVLSYICLDTSMFNARHMNKLTRSAARWVLRPGKCVAHATLNARITHCSFDWKRNEGTVKKETKDNTLWWCKKGFMHFWMEYSKTLQSRQGRLLLHLWSQNLPSWCWNLRSRFLLLQVQ